MKIDNMALFDIAKYCFGLAKDYYGELTDDQIKKFISWKENWIMYPHTSIHSKQEGESAPYPNVYVSYNEDEDSYVGLSFNNYPSLEWIFSLKNPSNKSTLDNIENRIKNLPESYMWEIYRRCRIKRRTFFYPVLKDSVKNLSIQSIIDNLKNLIPIYKGLAGTMSEDGKGRIQWVAPSLSPAYISYDSLDALKGAFQTTFSILREIFEARIGNDVIESDHELLNLKIKISELEKQLLRKYLPDSTREKYKQMLKKYLDILNKKYPGESIP